MKRVRNEIIKKVCYCGTEFETTKELRRFCSKKCGKGYHNIRSKEVSMIKAEGRENVASICNTCINQYAHKCEKVKMLDKVPFENFKFIKEFKESKLCCYVYKCDNYRKDNRKYASDN